MVAAPIFCYLALLRVPAVSIHITQWLSSARPLGDQLCELFALSGRREERGCALTIRCCSITIPPWAILLPRSLSTPEATAAPSTSLFKAADVKDVTAEVSTSPGLVISRESCAPTQAGDAKAQTALRNPERSFLSREGLQGQLVLPYPQCSSPGLNRSQKSHLAA